MPTGIYKREKSMSNLFQKGFKPWNKGLKLGPNPEHSARMKGRIPWNKQNLFIKCIICGKEFKCNKYAIEVGNRKYCSKLCAYKSRIGRPWSEKRYRNTFIKVCLRCKKEFKVWGSKLKRGEVKYCSKDCYYPPLFKNCVVCKIKFKSSPSNEQTHCSFKCYQISKKGHIPWNKGKHPEYMQGKNHPNWKGGITPIHRAIRASVDYEEWRKKVFERDLYTCQYCHKIGGYLHADHIKRFADYPELRLDINNGQTLCEECHDIKTKLEGKLYWKNQFKKSSVYLNKYGI